MNKKEKFELKHHKDFHRIQFQDFNTKERKLIFALCYKLMEQESDILEFNVKEITKISGYKPTKAGDNIYKSLEETYKRIKNASIKIKKENGVKHFVLFTTFETFEDRGIVRIRVNDEYRYLLNQITAPFTIQNVIEYRNLNSGYSQLLYSLLKEWEKKKEYICLIEDFRNDLGIPPKYRISEIDKFVLTPIMTELPHYFSSLKFEKIKTGKKVTGLKFTWDKRKDIIEIVDETPHKKIEISQNLYNLIKKVQSSTFLKNVMTPRNIEKLTKKYNEKTLIQIFKKAKNSTFQPIKSIKYFDYVFESIKNEPVIIIKPAEKIVEKEVPTYAPVEKIEKIDITLKEFNKKYKEYLKKWKSPDDPFVKRAFEIKYNIVEVEEKSTQEIKVFTEKDIPENELLGKNGKKLAGMALQMRINKILKKNDLV